MLGTLSSLLTIITVVFAQNHLQFVQLGVKFGFLVYHITEENMLSYTYK